MSPGCLIRVASPLGGERPPPTATVERGWRLRIAAAHRAEKRGGVPARDDCRRVNSGAVFALPQSPGKIDHNHDVDDEQDDTRGRKTLDQFVHFKRNE